MAEDSNTAMKVGFSILALLGIIMFVELFTGPGAGAMRQPPSPKAPPVNYGQTGAQIVNTAAQAANVANALTGIIGGISQDVNEVSDDVDDGSDDS